MASKTYKINDKYYITKASSTEFKTNLVDGIEQSFPQTTPEYSILTRIFTFLANSEVKPISPEQKDNILSKFYANNFKFSPEELADRLVCVEAAVVNSNNEVDLSALEQAFQKLIDWFADFHVEISYRFVDTLLRVKNKKQYILNYFKLSDHPAYNDICAKINEPEFQHLITKLNYIPQKAPVNTRLKIYFGPAGTGKTYKAQTEADYTILCSSDMSCKDLLQVFDFEDGKATFNKSDLWIAIEEGKTVLLDEVNLLNHDTLQFLQGLTDGKPTIDFLGHKIKVHSDFKVIGTMNLIVNGMKFPMPEPLVDRCFEIDEYTLTAQDLIRTLV